MDVESSGDPGPRISSPISDQGREFSPHFNKLIWPPDTINKGSGSTYFIFAFFELAEAHTYRFRKKKQAKQSVAELC